MPYLEIGATPCEEKCQQVGMPSYDAAQARWECQVFLEQIRRELGREPDGALLVIKSFRHDYGSYLEVCCRYEDGNEAAMDYAYRCEAESPANWDATSRSQLTWGAKSHIPSLTFGAVLNSKHAS